jgi:hypothetical protein
MCGQFIKHGITFSSESLEGKKLSKPLFGATRNTIKLFLQQFSTRSPCVTCMEKDDHTLHCCVIPSLPLGHARRIKSLLKPPPICLHERNQDIGASSACSGQSCFSKDPSSFCKQFHSPVRSPIYPAANAPILTLAPLIPFPLFSLPPLLRLMLATHALGSWSPWRHRDHRGCSG